MCAPRTWVIVQRCGRGAYAVRNVWLSHHEWTQVDMAKPFPEGQRLWKMKAADAALFGALWWPYAPFEHLKIATYLSIWVCPLIFPILVYMTTSTDLWTALYLGWRYEQPDSVQFAAWHICSRRDRFFRILRPGSELHAALRFRAETIEFNHKCLDGGEDISMPNNPQTPLLQILAPLDKQYPSPTLLVSW